MRTVVLNGRRTDVLDRARDDLHRRWGRVEELVGPLLFLVSPASDFVNGQVLYVDGGMLSVL
jgi:NAD(P)-dependent dehydrogenase (short-subunit alcohol dehydrogenase family)